MLVNSMLRLVNENRFKKPSPTSKEEEISAWNHSLRKWAHYISMGRDVPIKWILFSESVSLLTISNGSFFFIERNLNRDWKGVGVPGSY